ncbi:Uncharacterized protein GBIM_17189 [Gryllus bimaculatus]|nr:Uncharacterized protein GBIM_17189 [Gryllus bimaculatus]
MKITCSICRTLFVATDVVFRTKCGHLFHFRCLKLWLKGSKSCPQCRAKLNEKQVSRINFSLDLRNAHRPKEVTQVLNNKVHNLKRNMSLKNRELQECNEEIKKLRMKETKMRDERDFWKAEVSCKRSNNKILREEFEIMRKRNNFLESCRTERERLQKEVRFLENMEIVRTGSLEKVDEILKDYRVSTKANDLVSNTSFLKQEMLRSVAEKEGLINKLHEAESNVVSLTEQKQACKG